MVQTVSYILVSCDENKHEISSDILMLPKNNSGNNTRIMQKHLALFDFFSFFLFSFKGKVTQREREREREIFHL